MLIALPKFSVSISEPTLMDPYVTCQHETQIDFSGVVGSLSPSFFSVNV